MQAALLSGGDAPHPLFLLSYSSLASLCLLVPVVGALEPRGYATALQLHASNASFAPLLLLSCGAAFATNLSNFLVARELGALTAQVVGNAKNGEGDPRGRVLEDVESCWGRDVLWEGVYRAYCWSAM